MVRVESMRAERTRAEEDRLKRREAKVTRVERERMAEGRRGMSEGEREQEGEKEKKAQGMPRSMTRANEKCITMQLPRASLIKPVIMHPLSFFHSFHSDFCIFVMHELK